MKVENLYNNEWLSLKRIISPEDGVADYVFSHETRCNGKIVSLLPYRIISTPNGAKFEFMLRKEITPCWDGLNQVINSITGGVEGGGGVIHYKPRCMNFTKKQGI